VVGQRLGVGADTGEMQVEDRILDGDYAVLDWS
jgi:hypothetical protein